LILFGAAVWFKPSRTKYTTDKSLPTAVVDVFLGYRFAPGGTWNGEYLVEDFTYFMDLDFSQDAPGHARVLAPHITKQVRLPSRGKITFPLKRHYDMGQLHLRWGRVATTIRQTTCLTFPTLVIYYLTMNMVLVKVVMSPRPRRLR
jgi:hypothetical protein